MDIQQHPDHPQNSARVSAAITALLLLLATGTVVYHTMEKWTWVQSFYFTVATLATVGYGDLHPTTDHTRLFTAFFILIGVAVALTALGILGTSYLERHAIRIVENEDSDSARK